MQARDSKGRFIKDKFSKGEYFICLESLSTRYPQPQEPKTKYVLSSKEYNTIEEAKKEILRLQINGVLKGNCRIFRVDRKYKATVKTDVLVEKVDL